MWSVGSDDRPGRSARSRPGSRSRSGVTSGSSALAMAVAILATARAMLPAASRTPTRRRGGPRAGDLRHAAAAAPGPRPDRDARDPVRDPPGIAPRLERGLPRRRAAPAAGDRRARLRRVHGRDGRSAGSRTTAGSTAGASTDHPGRGGHRGRRASSAVMASGPLGQPLLAFAGFARRRARLLADVPGDGRRRGLAARHPGRPRRRARRVDGPVRPRVRAGGVGPRGRRFGPGRGVRDPARGRGRHRAARRAAHGRRPASSQPRPRPRLAQAPPPRRASR